MKRAARTTTIHTRALVAVAVFGLLTAASGTAQAQDEWLYESTWWGTDAYASDSDPIYDYWADGWGLVGRDLNGTLLDGTSLNGRQILDIDLTSLTVPGGEVKRVSLEAGRIRAIMSTRAVKEAADLVGATLLGGLDDGKRLILRFDGIATDPQPFNRDVLLYKISYQTASGWQPYCGLSDGGYPVAAVALNGKWDAVTGNYSKRGTTFACVGSAVGKCAMRGYAPWRAGDMNVCKKNGASGVPKCEKKYVEMANYHLACVRMMRADYCGDGTSHTMKGVDINLYDAQGIRRDANDWTFEAEWDAKGAVCVSQARLSNITVDSRCWSKLYNTDCGNTLHFSWNTLMMSEFKPTTAP